MLFDISLQRLLNSGSFSRLYKRLEVYCRQTEIKAFAGILKGKVHASSDGRKYYLTNPVL